MRNALELFMLGRVTQKQPPEDALRKKLFKKTSVPDSLI